MHKTPLYGRRMGVLVTMLVAPPLMTLIYSLSSV